MVRSGYFLFLPLAFANAFHWFVAELFPVRLDAFLPVRVVRVVRAEDVVLPAWPIVQL